MVTVRWLAVAALLVSQHALATTFYVSSVSGLDRNNGPSPSTPTLADLGGSSWVDLGQDPVRSLLLPPFGSAVLVRRLDAIFTDGFENGTTSAWSVTLP